MLSKIYFVFKKSDQDSQKLINELESYDLDSPNFDLKSAEGDSTGLVYELSYTSYEKYNPGLNITESYFGAEKSKVEQFRRLALQNHHLFSECYEYENFSDKVNIQNKLNIQFARNEVQVEIVSALPVRSNELAQPTQFVLARHAALPVGKHAFLFQQGTEMSLYVSKSDEKTYSTVASGTLAQNVQVTLIYPNQKEEVSLEFEAGCQVMFFPDGGLSHVRYLNGDIRSFPYLNEIKAVTVLGEMKE